MRKARYGEVLFHKTLLPTGTVLLIYIHILWSLLLLLAKQSELRRCRQMTSSETAASAFDVSEGLSDSSP